MAPPLALIEGREKSVTTPILLSQFRMVSAGEAGSVGEHVTSSPLTQCDVMLWSPSRSTRSFIKCYSGSGLGRGLCYALLGTHPRVPTSKWQYIHSTIMRSKCDIKEAWWSTKVRMMTTLIIAEVNLKWVVCWITQTTMPHWQCGLVEDRWGSDLWRDCEMNIPPPQYSNLSHDRLPCTMCSQDKKSQKCSMNLSCTSSIAG